MVYTMIRLDVDIEKVKALVRELRNCFGCLLFGIRSEACDFVGEQDC